MSQWWIRLSIVSGAAFVAYVAVITGAHRGGAATASIDACAA